MAKREVELFGCTAEEMTAEDLCDEYRKLRFAVRPVATFRVCVWEDGVMLPECGWLLWLFDDLRGGVAWGSPATWTDASDPDDCAERVIVTGEVIN